MEPPCPGQLDLPSPLESPAPSHQFIRRCLVGNLIDRKRSVPKTTEQIGSFGRWNRTRHGLQPTGEVGQRGKRLLSPHGHNATARVRHVICLDMEEPEEIAPPVQPTSKLGLRSRIAALSIWAKVGLIVALTVVVAYWIYFVVAISMNVIGEGLGL